MGVERRPRCPGHVWHQMVLPIEGFSCGARIKLPTMNPFAWFGVPAILSSWRAGAFEEFAPRGSCAHPCECKSFVIE